MATTARTNRSAAAVSGTNLTLEPVERFVDRGLLRRCMTVFGCRAALVSASDKKLTLQRMFGNTAAQGQDATITYPYMLLTPTDVAEDTTGRYNTHLLSREGFVTVFADDSGVLNGGGDSGMKRAWNVHLIPVEYQVQVEYVTNSAAAMRNFASEWLFARRKSWLSFDVEYGQLKITVRVEPSASLSLPLREADLGTEPTYTVSTQLTLHAFVSQATLVEQQLITNLNVTGAVDEQGGAVFMSFDSRTESSEDAPTETENGLTASRYR